jgi:hypothetical protein
VLRIAIAVLIALPAFAQIPADIAALESHSSLATWRKAHPGERFEPAHYDTSNDHYQVDYARLNRWCAASVSGTRTALFYVPSPVPATLPVVTDNCEFDALWYEFLNDSDAGRIVPALSAAWGKPNGAVSEPDIQGWALWKSAVAWHRPHMDIWVARNTKSNLIVYARRNMPRDWDAMDHWFGSVTEGQSLVVDAVARIAALGPALTSPILNGSRCAAGPADRSGAAAEPLTAWLTSAQNLPPGRQAAAFLLADFYITCAGTSPDSDLLGKRFVALGAKYEIRSPQDDPDYAHNFRERAEHLDPHGPAGELAGLVSLSDPCFLKGKNSWPDNLIEKGMNMLSAFPSTRWTPYVRYAVARAHATKLSFALPGDNPEGFSELDPTELQRERAAAIAQFRIVSSRNQGAPESLFATQEAWRLSAGLPPSQIHFGCTGE